MNSYELILWSLLYYTLDFKTLMKISYWIIKKIITHVVYKSIKKQKDDWIIVNS